jgi:chemotaxis protein methyltransferase CheR
LAHISITLDDFLKFREFFYRKTGIRFEENKRYFVDKRLLERMEATHSSSFREYFSLLRFGNAAAELQILTNVMTVNETYFFREDYQFKCLVDSLLPDLVKRKAAGSTIRIWSIPSSSGEEAYSIAIYLLEYWRGIAQWDVEIISSDIDTHILQKAKQGIYNKRSLQHVPDTLLHKYFQALGDGQYQICQDLRDVVNFTRVNLSDVADTCSYRHFDVIFCRNLLIYFDDLSRLKAAEVFFDALEPGGFICLGHSESMSRISSLFRIRHFPQAIVYQKQETPAL